MKINSVTHEFSVILAIIFLSLAASFAILPQSAGAADKKIMAVLGDSLTAGYGLAPGKAFPEQLQSALKAKGHDLQMINAGVSGDTSTGGLARLDWSLGADVNFVIVELGANDALRGIQPSLTASNLETIITRLKSRGVKVMLAGMQAPPNMGEQYGEEFNAIFADLATKHDTALYPFFLDGVAAIPSLNQADGIHPTSEGIAVIVKSILPDVISWLEAEVFN